MPRQLPCSLIAVLFFALTPSLLRAQQQNTAKPGSLSGCLRQGIEPHGYYLDSHDGKMWELRGNIDKNEVGREVTVEGHERPFSMNRQAELITDEKQEANGRPYYGFEVTSIKMLSTSCR